MKRSRLKRSGSCKSLMELKQAYKKWQTSDNESDYDRFVRVCEKNLK